MNEENEIIDVKNVELMKELINSGDAPCNMHKVLKEIIERLEQIEGVLK